MDRILLSLGLCVAACSDKAPPAPSSPPASGSTAAPAPAPTPAPPAAPARDPFGCGMPSNPGMAKDLGKATLTIDGEALCGNYWLAHGFAKGQRLEVNMLAYASDQPPTLAGPASSLPTGNAPQRYTLLDKATPIAIGINLAHKFSEREYASATLELSGFTLAQWDGKPLKAAVERDGLGWAMAKDRSKPTAFVRLELQRGSAPRETLYGKEGELVIERYDFAKQAFEGSFRAKVGPIEGLGAGKPRTFEGTFAIRLLD